MGRIEIIFLGTTAGIPTRERSHPAIHLSYQGERKCSFLFDCGEGTQRQMLFADLNFMKINEIFITHWHGDHYLGLPGLVDTMSFEDRKKLLTVYSPEPGRVRKLLNLGYHPGSFEILYKAAIRKGGGIENLLETDEFKIVSVPVRHTVPSVAYALLEKDKFKIDKQKLKNAGFPTEAKIYGELKRKGEIMLGGRRVELEEVCSLQRGKKIVYSGDTKICDNLIKIAQNADLLIHDCTYFNGKNFEEYGHASIEDMVELLRKVRVGKVILTHISRRYKNSKKLKEKVKNYPNLEIAKDLMRVIV